MANLSFVCNILAIRQITSYKNILMIKPPRMYHKYIAAQTTTSLKLLFVKHLLYSCHTGKCLDKPKDL